MKIHGCIYTSSDSNRFIIVLKCHIWLLNLGDFFKLRCVAYIFFMSLSKADGHESRGCDANIVCNILLFFLTPLYFAHFVVVVFKCLVIFLHVCHIWLCLSLWLCLPCFTVSSVFVCHKFWVYVFFPKTNIIRISSELHFKALKWRRAVMNGVNKKRRPCVTAPSVEPACSLWFIDVKKKNQD